MDQNQTFLNKTIIIIRLSNNVRHMSDKCLSTLAMSERQSYCDPYFLIISVLLLNLNTEDTRNDSRTGSVRIRLNLDCDNSEL